MKHFGDITKIDGTKVPIVDIVVGGSPCQDLSVAGKRAGLDGERSGLFMEQLRIIKEMRKTDEQQRAREGSNRPIRPRYMVWENVPGVFSSGTPLGADFQAVLEETVKVVRKDCPPIPIPGDGWSYSGNLDGVGADGTPFSISWRVHDAQYWGKTVIDNCGRVVKAGTPQRRSRVSLVADFGGITAPEILFECESVSGNSQSSGAEREGTPDNSETGVGEPSAYTLKVRGGAEFDSSGRRAGKGALVQEELSGTLGLSQDQTLIQTQVECLNSWDIQSKHIQPENGIAEALYSGECRYGGGESYVMQSSSGVDLYNQKLTGNVACSLNTNTNATGAGPTVMQSEITASGFKPRNGADANGIGYEQEVAPTVETSQNSAVVYGVTAKGNGDAFINPNTHTSLSVGGGEPGQGYPCILQHEPCMWDGSQISPTLTANNAGGGQRMPDKDNFNAVIAVDEGGGKSSCAVTENVSPTLATTHHGEPVVCYGLDRASFNQGKNAKYDFSVEEEVAQTIVSRGPGGVMAAPLEHCAQETTKE